MSTTLLPPVTPPPPPEHIADPNEPGPLAPEIAEFRRTLRRRMIFFSAPVVLLLVLVALKLLSMPLLAAVSQATYDGHSYDQSVKATDGLALGDVFEPWVREFDRGAGLAQIGVLTDSRNAFERSLALVPKSDVAASCLVRTDLLLVVEQQGDSAVLDQHYSTAEAFYAHALALYDGAPEGCFRDPSSSSAPPTKKPLRDAHNRLQQKQQQAQQDAGGDQQGSSGSGGSSQGDSGGGSSSGQGQGQPGTGGGSGSGSGSGSGDSQGSSGSSGSSGQDPLQQLQQQDDQAQTQQQQNDDRQRYFSQNPEDYSGKPW